jgi:uncharacterized membrane protein HdeD (DUF308 family)
MSNIHIEPSRRSPFLGLALRELAENWWLLLLRGVAAIAFGLLAFSWPDLTLLTLIFLWGLYAIADGIIALWAAIASKDVYRQLGNRHWYSTDLGRDTVAQRNRRRMAARS